MQGDDLSGLEEADQIHEMVTGYLKKALLAVHEVGAMERMEEEKREVAGLSAGSPKLI